MNEQRIIAEYENANEEGKKMLLRIFDEGIFVKKFIKKPAWIQLWNEFCLENNLSVRLPYANPQTPEEEYDNASVMLRHIIRIRISQPEYSGWVPDWNNEKQYKYYPRFDMRTNKDNILGGLSFGFSGTDCDSWGTLSTAVSRLCYPTAELCKETAIKFLPIYEKFFR